MTGDHVVLDPMDPALHADGLYETFRHAPDSMWTYLPYGPFERASMREQLGLWSGSTDPMFFVIVDVPTLHPLGWAAFLRIDPDNGTIEVGHISYSPVLARTTAATETMWLMMRRVFEELGYRRYEWKCDALNARSRAAAERLGFTFEGVFRNAVVYRGRNRDTAWYSMTDKEWPAADEALRAWLAPGNHVGAVQARSLKEIRSNL